VNVAADAAGDLAGNGNVAATEFVQLVDTINPTVSITSDREGQTATGDVTFRFTFDDDVTGFDASAGPIPMSQIQVISQDLNEEYGLEEGIVDTVKDKYARFKDHFDDSPEAIERKLARLRASGAEAQPGANAVAPVQQSAEDPYMILGIQPGADSNAIKLAYRRLAKQHHPDAGGNAAEFQKIKAAFNELLASGAVIREGTAGLPDPQNYDSDVDYYNDRDAEDTTDSDADYENMDDAESDDWFDESKEKIGNMDADAFDAALSRMKKLAGAGPLRTVYDPARRVYKNVPHAVQPAQQPKKVR
jgi:DnaJ-domain-containing protein 1